MKPLQIIAFLFCLPFLVNSQQSNPVPGSDTIGLVKDTIRVNSATSPSIPLPVNSPVIKATAPSPPVAQNKKPEIFNSDFY